MIDAYGFFPVSINNYYHNKCYYNNNCLREQIIPGCSTGSHLAECSLATASESGMQLSLVPRPSPARAQRNTQKNC